MGELFAYKEESSNSKVIGLLIKTAMEGDTMYARLLNGAGELLELACADTFRLSGPFGNDPAVRESMRIRNHEDAYKRITARFNGNLIQEAVMYAVNADNKIASVDFAVEHNSALENGDPNLEGDGFHYILKDFTSMVYFYNPRAFITKTPRGLDQTLLTAAGIQWFTVPETYGNLPDEQVFSAAATGLTNDKTAVVKLYSTTGSLPIADVGLVQADSSTVDGTTESYGVSEKATTIYNETPAIELTLVSGGQEKSYYAEDSDEIRDLEPGDVIQMSTDVTGKIIKCSKVLDFHKEDGRPYLSVEGSSDGNFWDSSGVASSVSPGTISRFMFGTAYRMFDSKLFLVKPNELETAKTASEAIDLSAFTNIMVFDCRTRKWKKGSRDDVNSYYNAGDEASMLFLRMNYSNARELFVYNP